MTIAPNCTYCGKTLKDWMGNIMVNNDKYTEEGHVTDLQVVCKACTNKIDPPVARRKLHSLWELHWVKEEPMNRMASIIANLIRTDGNGKHWDKEAIQEVGFLVALTMPYEEAFEFLRYFCDEWGESGKYLNALNAKHGKEQYS